MRWRKKERRCGFLLPGDINVIGQISALWLISSIYTEITFLFVKSSFKDKQKYSYWKILEIFREMRKLKTLNIYFLIIRRHTFYNYFAILPVQCFMKVKMQMCFFSGSRKLRTEKREQQNNKERKWRRKRSGWWRRSRTRSGWNFPSTRSPVTPQCQ